MSNIKLTTYITKNGIEWNLDVVEECMILTPLNTGIDKKYLLIFDGCNFHDDIWNFNKFNKIGRSRVSYILNFSKIEYPYNYYAKKIVLDDLYLKQRKSPSTTKTMLDHLRHFFTWLANKKIYYAELINLHILEEFFNTQNLCEVTVQQKKNCIKKFISELERIFPKLDLTDELNYLCTYDKQKLSCERENNKIALIPFETNDNRQSIFDKIVLLALLDINNADLSILEKKSACMIVILAETGMRIGEFHKLELNRLSSITVPQNKDKQYYLEFLTYKTAPSEGYWTLTYMTSTAAFAYNSLFDLLSECRNGTKYLYVNERTGDQYASEGSLWEHILRFFYKHQSDFEFGQFTVDELKAFNTMEIRNTNKKRFGCSSADIGQLFYYINAHQFRVTVATILYVKNHRRLEWIKRHMNHLSDEMTIHYIREEAFKQKKINLVETLIKRASTEGNILETDPTKIINPNIRKELEDENLRVAYKEINDFLENFFLKQEKGNIFKDINQIINSLYSKKISLSEIPMGFCAADALLVLCERQEYINLIESSYDMGIIIPTLETLPFHIKRFQEKVQVINYNKTLASKGSYYYDIYLKEIDKLKVFIKNKLLPDLELLESEVNNLGFDKVLSKHKELVTVVPKFGEIKREANQWIINN